MAEPIEQTKRDIPAEWPIVGGEPAAGIASADVRILETRKAKQNGSAVYGVRVHAAGRSLWCRTIGLDHFQAAERARQAGSPISAFLELTPSGKILFEPLHYER